MVEHESDKFEAAGSSPAPRTIRVFIGSSKEFACCESIIERSIRENTQSDVEITFMRPETLGVPITGCTGFTNLRYAVPELAGYSGYAIYLDVDMIVLGDIAELYSYAEAGRWVVMKDGANEVAVISCGTHRHLPTLQSLHKYNKHELKAMCRESRRIPSEWNCEDAVTEGMKLLHFTDMKCQPWLENPQYPHPCPEAVAIYEGFVQKTSGEGNIQRLRSGVTAQRRGRVRKSVVES